MSQHHHSQSQQYDHAPNDYSEHVKYSADNHFLDLDPSQGGSNLEMIQHQPAELAHEQRSDAENSFAFGGGGGGDADDVSRDSDGISSDEDSEDFHDVSRETVIQRIEDIILSQSILEPLAAREVPAVQHPHKTFLHNIHCRILTSMFLVADFCHELLIGRRTTTIREVYYHFVTHFRNQAECDKAIWDLAASIRVPRAALGLVASPKGWCCGCLELYDKQTGDLMWNGRVLDIHGTGVSITMNLLQATVESTDARCIIVIEKEGIYTRLSEDKFFQQYPCILVTGKGFPDIATRRWVQHLQRVLNLPVYGLCDGNPYGISVLHTYQYDQKSGVAYAASSQGRRGKASTFHIKWLGLRPSQLEDLALPPSVFQQLTDLDKKCLESLMNETHIFHQLGNSELRIQELEDLESGGRKVELEALNWLGMDFLCQWLKNILEQHDEEVASDPDGATTIII
jgi:meiotic recombination protein SPO11